MSDAEQPKVDPTPDEDNDPELDQPSFPGGLSRREIGAGREFWQSHVHTRGGLRFDALDGFLTALSLLPHPPPPQHWTGLALGPNLAAARDDDREQAVAWMYRFGTHVAHRVRLDPAVHQSSVLPEFDFLPRVGEHLARDTEGYFNYYNIVKIWHRQDTAEGTFRACLLVTLDD